MQVHNTTFQIKTVFTNVLFSTEVHNPLHAHLLALSQIQELEDSLWPVVDVEDNFIETAYLDDMKSSQTKY